MIRFFLSLIFAKFAYYFLKLTKLSGGTAIIGKYVLKICPDFLLIVNKYINTKINVTGTNGKTTSSGLISHLIKNSSHSILNNELGANMLNGVVNALSIELNPLKKYDFSIIESDEAFLEIIYEKLDADYLLVTNLFRDQLDRYGELATTKNFIQKGINKHNNLTLVLNADDPLVSSFSGGKKHIFYGVKEVIYADGLEKTNSSTEEIFNCPCGKPLKYSKKFYAQQGHYYCDCGYKRPEVNYEAKVTLHKDHSTIEFSGEEKYNVPLVGLFNAYNALGAIAICKELGIQNIQENLMTFKVAFGRSEIKYLNNKKTLIQLIKNPIGANEVIKTIDLDSNLLIIINDNYADGRDVSWLWDTDFSLLKNIKKEIVVSGKRANDIALRLKYAGIETNKITVICNIKQAVEYIGKNAQSDITILPTYTALLELNKMSIFKKK